MKYKWRHDICLYVFVFKLVLLTQSCCESMGTRMWFWKKCFFWKVALFFNGQKLILYKPTGNIGIVSYYMEQRIRRCTLVVQRGDDKNVVREGKEIGIKIEIGIGWPQRNCWSQFLASRLMAYGLKMDPICA